MKNAINRKSYPWISKYTVWRVFSIKKNKYSWRFNPPTKPSKMTKIRHFSAIFFTELALWGGGQILFLSPNTWGILFSIHFRLIGRVTVLIFENRHIQTTSNRYTVNTYISKSHFYLGLYGNSTWRLIPCASKLHWSHI